MPISYAHDISEGQGVCIFLRLLARWKGSLYKLVLIDLGIYMGLYYFLNFLYRFAFNESQQNKFDEIVKFSDSIQKDIPISFLLGFFVAGVIGRWWQMFMAIPWLNRIAFLVDGYVVGKTPPEARKIRLILLRYMNLSWILLMRKISDQMKNRFRYDVDNQEESTVREVLMNFNKDRKIQATFRKIITDSEIRAFENIAARNSSKGKYEPEYWIPLQWASLVVRKSFIHGYISDPRTCNTIIEEIDNLRSNMQTLQLLCSIMIPLVYTQVVIIAVYSFFLCQLFSTQFIRPEKALEGHKIDFYVPFFTIFQFLFLMGWLKVAMCVMNPFGDDDEDFQTSDILDENLDVTYRCAIGDSGFFPDHLDPAVFKFRLQDGHDEDNLDAFLEDVDNDLEEIYPGNPDDDMTALEMQRTQCQKLRDVICCKRCKSSPRGNPHMQMTRDYNRENKRSVYDQSTKDPEIGIAGNGDKDDLKDTLIHSKT